MQLAELTPTEQRTWLSRRVRFCKTGEHLIFDNRCDACATIRKLRAEMLTLQAAGPMGDAALRDQLDAAQVEIERLRNLLAALQSAGRGLEILSYDALIDSVRLNLSHVELKFLTILADRGPLTHVETDMAVWGQVSTNRLGYRGYRSRVTLSRLRKKISRAGFDPEHYILRVGRTTEVVKPLDR